MLKNYWRRPELNILFVCTENICRSPLAEALLRHSLKERGLSRKIGVLSSGVICSMPGHRPDVRVVQVATDHGLTIPRIRASQTSPEQIEKCDLVLAMERSHLQAIRDLSESHLWNKTHLLLEYAGGSGLDEVPDPYYGSLQGFELVFSLLQNAMDPLLERLISSGD